MRIAVVIAILLLASLVYADPIITSTNFLNAEPEKLCGGYLIDTYGDSVMWFTQPHAGAVIRLQQTEGSILKYLFCDVGFHKVIIFSLYDVSGHREPIGIKGYGLDPEYSEYIYRDTVPPVLPISLEDRSDTGFFFQPTDIAISSRGRYFDAEVDRIYVLDQVNRRIVKLRYDEPLDSLIWEASFGQNDLIFPTSLAYADYGDSEKSNDDVYVTDGLIPGIIRYSTDGLKEASFCGWGSNLASVAYPTGMAVLPYSVMPDRIFVTDSKNHRIVRYYSPTAGPIEAEIQYVFPNLLEAKPLIEAVDIDDEGIVYVVNSFAHNITLLKPDFSQVMGVFGSRGYGKNQFEYPQDIYIDGSEMQICENWSDSSGIQSYELSDGQPKKETETLPHSFCLHQNYPNPFNSRTIIAYELPQRGEVELNIYNILGQRVVTLVKRQMEAGVYMATWDGRNGYGEPVVSGIYFSRLRLDEDIAVKKLLLIK